MLLMTGADQVVVHELAPVIRMDAQEREREVAANAAQCSGDMFLTLLLLSLLCWSRFIRDATMRFRVENR